MCTPQNSRSGASASYGLLSYLRHALVRDATSVFYCPSRLANPILRLKRKTIESRFSVCSDTYDKWCIHEGVLKIWLLEKFIWWCHICCWWLFWPMWSKNCNTDGITVRPARETMLKNISHFVTVHESILVNLWTFQTTMLSSDMVIEWWMYDIASMCWLTKVGIITHRSP